MRWIPKQIRLKNKIGSTRKITRFLVFPLTLENETRWLEIVTILQELDYVDVLNSSALRTYVDVLNSSALRTYKLIKWVNVRWYTPTG